MSVDACTRVWEGAEAWAIEGGLLGLDLNSRATPGGAPARPETHARSPRGFENGQSA